MQKTFISKSKEQTQEMGKMLAQELQGGEVVCLVGELGSGKTTFTQGLLQGLKIPGPYTSPTFNIMKCYKGNGDVYHCDAYRITERDMLELGWEEMIDPSLGKKNIIVVEWADRVSKIMPKRSLWIEFEWLSENERKIIVKSNK